MSVRAGSALTARYRPGPANATRTRPLSAWKRVPSGAKMPRAFLVRGQIALLRRKYADATRELNRAVAADPDLAEAYGYLSQAYAAAGQPEKSRRAAADHNAASTRRRLAEARAAR